MSYDVGVIGSEHQVINCRIYDNILFDGTIKSFSINIGSPCDPNTSYNVHSRFN